MYRPTSFGTIEDDYAPVPGSRTLRLSEPCRAAVRVSLSRWCRTLGLKKSPLKCTLKLFRRHIHMLLRTIRRVLSFGPRALYGYPNSAGAGPGPLVVWSGSFQSAGAD
jgi:hypothetical protein